MFINQVAVSQCTGNEPLISQVAEGSASNKAVEIYNPSSNPLDLSMYELVRFANGGATGTSISLSGTLAAGDVFVIANPSANSDILAVQDQTSGTISHNGNDSYVLQKTDGTVVDSYGDTDNNATFGANMNMQRNITDPCPYDTNPTDAFDPSAYTSASYSTGLPPGLGAFIGFLPVDLVSFEARVRNSVSFLTWSTASEINNDKFEIERSFDGKSYVLIGEVEGVGNSLRLASYSYEDTSPLPGTNYYRLKQVDFDGAYEYSPVVVARVSDAKVTITPKQTYDRLTVTTNNDEAANVAIVGMSGQLLISQSFYNSTEVDLSELPSGVYLVRIYSAGTITTDKVVKL